MRKKKKIERKKTYTTTKTDNESINNYMKSVSDYLKKYKVSVGYINLDNGFTYIYNGNKEYFGASLIKVIDAMYIYENNLSFLSSKCKKIEPELNYKIILNNAINELKKFAKQKSVANYY